MKTPRDWEENVSQSYSAHHKSHMDVPEHESGPPGSEAGDQPPEAWHGLTSYGDEGSIFVISFGQDLLKLEFHRIWTRCLEGKGK
jgi:hypothetical protein